MKKNLLNNIFILGIVFLLLFSFVKLTFADTNGIWTLAQDVRGGTFGSDEQDVTTFYKFINPIYFIEPINVSIIYSTYSKDYYINLSGRSQLNDVASNQISTNYLNVGKNLKLNNIKSCSGKLYTDSNGNVVCGTDNVNDADSDPTNELQNLYQVLSKGNNAGGRRITDLGNPIYSSDAATKGYVDAATNRKYVHWDQCGYKRICVTNTATAYGCAPSGYVIVDNTCGLGYSMNYGNIWSSYTSSNCIMLTQYVMNSSYHIQECCSIKYCRYY